MSRTTPPNRGSDGPQVAGLRAEIVLPDPSKLKIKGPDQFTLIGTGIILWFGHTSHYQLRMPFWMEAKKIVEAIGFALLVSCFLHFVSKENFSRLALLSCWGFSIITIISFRSITDPSVAEKDSRIFSSADVHSRFCSQSL